MTKIKPLGNRVLVRRLQATKTSGGILLPESAQEKPKEGEVVEVGPGTMEDNGSTRPLTVKIGDRVLFTSYAGTEVKQSSPSQDEEYLIMSEDDLLCVIG